MQDGASDHAAASTLQELAERDVRVIWWPAFSPDLNPIETVWNKMKDWIQNNYEKNLSYDQLRDAMTAAWEQISEQFLDELMDSMPARCEAVILADGMHTRYWNLHVNKLVDLQTLTINILNWRKNKKSPN